MPRRGPSPYVILGGAYIAGAAMGEVYRRVGVEQRLREVTRLEGNRGYGLLAFVFLVNNVLLRKLAFDVGGRRRFPPRNENEEQRRVEYPNEYATANDTISEEEANLFNCFQRAHQHTLEEAPEFLTLLAVAGAKYPVTTSLFGILNIIGKYQYAAGYQTGDPANRRRGGMFRYGALLLGLLPLAIDSAASFLLDR